jgi:hypothetical protein
MAIVTDIYSQYSLPLNLRTHMLRVAAVASLICDRLENVKIDKDIIVKTMLLHDLGNMLKFNFDRVDLFDPADQSKIDEYKQKQQELKVKYGTNSDQATLQMISEVTHDSRLVEFCRESHWERLGQYLNTDRLDIRVCTYADMRVGPFGLLSLDERISDLKKRRPEESDLLDRLLNEGKQVEAELAVLTKGRIGEITNDLVNQSMEVLKGKII